jgi:hypothetical protein
MCKSPISAQVNDDHTNHTLLVIMQDVCGSRVRILAKYGLWGYTLEEVTGRPEKTYDPSALAEAPLGSLSGGGSAGAAERLRPSHNGSDARRVRGGANAAERAGGLPLCVTLLVGLLGVVAGLWL